MGKRKTSDRVLIEHIGKFTVGIIVEIKTVEKLGNPAPIINYKVAWLVENERNDAWFDAVVPLPDQTWDADAFLNRLKVSCEKIEAHIKEAEEQPTEDEPTD